MRRRHGERFAWVSLYTVFGLQGCVMWIVSLPVQAVQAAPASAPGLLDAAGFALFGLGLGFEALGDAQLARFKANPDNAGRVMDRGLWAWTRHPNYFLETSASGGDSFSLPSPAESAQAGASSAPRS